MSIAKQKKRTSTWRTPGKKQKGLARKVFSALMGLAGFSFILVCSMGLLMLVSIALIYGYRQATSSDYLTLREIDIQGNRQLTSSELLGIMEIDTGENMLQLNMSELKNRLLDNPWIEKVRLRREFPNHLHISIHERQAYFWIQNDHNLYYADARGKIIASLSPQRVISLPVLYLQGDPGQETITSLVQALERRGFPFSMQDLAWIKVSETQQVQMYIYGLGIELAMGSGDMDRDMSRLNAVWQDLRQREEIDSVSRINMAGDNVCVAFKTGQRPEM